MPSPGRIEAGSQVEPASYMNFAICNEIVVVPTYGTVHDEDGVAAIAELFDIIAEVSEIHVVPAIEKAQHGRA